MLIINKAIYREVFNFHVERLDALQQCPLNDSAVYAYWANTAAVMEQIGAKYNHDEFCVDMLVTVFQQLEREFKRRFDINVRTDQN